MIFTKLSSSLRAVFVVSTTAVMLTACGSGSDSSTTTVVVAVVAAPAASAASAAAPAASAPVVVTPVVKPPPALTITNVATNNYVTTAEIGERCVPVARFTAYGDSEQDARLSQILIPNVAVDDRKLFEFIASAHLVDGNGNAVPGVDVSVDWEKFSMYRGNALRINRDISARLVDGQVYTVCVDINPNVAPGVKMAFKIDRDSGVGQVMMHAGTVPKYNIVGPELTVQSTVSLPTVMLNSAGYQAGQVAGWQKVYQYIVGCDSGCQPVDLRLGLYGVNVDQILVGGRRVDYAQVYYEYTVNGFYVNPGQPVAIDVSATVVADEAGNQVRDINAWVGDSSFWVWVNGRRVLLAPRVIFNATGGKV